MIKKLYRILKGRDFFYRPSIKIDKERFGSDYGGWWISPKFISKNSIVVSAGLGEDITFDSALIERFGCTIFGIDPTPKSAEYVEENKPAKGFSFHQIALANENGELVFNLPLNENHVSGSLSKIASTKSLNVKAQTLMSFMQEYNLGEIDILKMDIEGSEYSVLENIVQTDIRPKQILVEYHHFFDEISNETTLKSIELLKKNEYELFALEGYNYSFIHKSLLR